MTTMTAKATGFGPFADTQMVEFDLSRPESVVRGYNGVGKSTLVSLIRRALGDTSAAPTRTLGRDQPAEFLLEMAGTSITLRLGERYSGSNAAALAAFPVQLATRDTAQMEQLIGPDDQTASASPEAQGRRLIALAALAGIDASAENLSFLASGLDVPLTGWKSTNFADIRKELYSRLTAQARTFAARADEGAGWIKATKEQIAGIPPIYGRDVQTDPGVTPEQADAAYHAAARELARIEQSHASRCEQEARIRQLEQGAPAPEWPAALHSALADLTATFATPPASADTSRAAANLATVGSLLTATMTSLTAWRAQRKILETPVTGATAEDVEAARQKEVEAGLLRSHARSFHYYSQLTTALVATVETEARARAASKAFETAARQINARLGTLIQRAGLGQMSVNDDGDVVCLVDGQWFPFALRSRSQRVLASILLVASRAKPVPGKISLLLLSDTLYTSLDATTREILDACLEPYTGHVHILTEAPSEHAALTIGGAS
jgi:hypothetical protein